MSDKSFVSMEQHLCEVCGKPFDTNVILLDRRIMDSLERHTITGMGLCPDHQKLADDGFIALIEVDPHRSTITGKTVRPEDAYRTGTVVHMRREVAENLFTIAVQPIMFMPPEVTAHIQSLMAAGEGPAEKANG